MIETSDHRALQRAYRLDADDVYVRQRLLAEVRAHDAPHGLAGRFLDPAVVAAFGGAEVGQHLLEAGDDGIDQRAIVIVDAAQGHFRRRHGPAASVDDQAGRGRAVPQQLASLAQRRPVDRHHAVAIAGRPAGTWSMISAGPGASRTRVPLGATIVSGTWQARASAACSIMWRTSPWTGRAILGRIH